MLVFFTSPWIPPEWIRAHGHTPRGLWCANLAADRLPLSEGVCPFAESCALFARNHKDAAFIFESGCDQMRRAFDVLELQGGSFAFLFNTPATWQSAAPVRIFRSELERLGKWLEQLGGCTPTADKLLSEIRETSERHAQLLSAAEEPYSARQYADAVAQMHWDGSVNLPTKPRAPVSGTPLALVGGPLPASQWPLLDLIESAGGRIVLNATAGGERSLPSTGEPPDFGGDPLDYLTQVYFRHALDIFQRPNSRLYTWLMERLRCRHVRGILLWTYVGCDLWRAEAQHLRDLTGLPVCQLEAESVCQCAPTHAGRIQSFLELLA